MFLLLILAGYQNFPHINIEVPIAPLASKQFPHISLQSFTGSGKITKRWEPMTLKKSSASSSPASIPAKWLCQRPSCLPVLLEPSRAPPLHPLSPSHEQQYSPGGSFSSQEWTQISGKCWFQFSVQMFDSKVEKRKKYFRTFHGPSITSQHPRASLACHSPRCPQKSCTLPI